MSVTRNSLDYRGRLSLLCLLLLVLQLNLQLHPLDHLSEPDHPLCETCLLQSSSHYAVPATATLQTSVTPVPVLSETLQQQPTTLCITAYQVRAPPNTIL
ncbi:hypothetical protein [Neptuniibacter sp. CAU 1671]|uniref:hypothetical protein n=1 Tax=Neptuniibacter sp. CAU 1671 TaxID=3032593 RepID=UPI0023D9D8B4|nr:hypothetical protein [Neptuniibacter sp. CAU 1671]MDF2181641.1 hypothetical protein [Neptuniibacter sp. CAU 1671]